MSFFSQKFIDAIHSSLEIRSEAMIPTVSLLDVTLRDGGFEVSFNWTPQFVRDFAAACFSTGIDTVELGYLGGVQKGSDWYDGFASDIPSDFIAQLAEVTAGSKLAAIITPWRLKREIDFNEYKGCGLNLLRIAYNPSFADLTWKIITAAQKAEIPICLNITSLSKYNTTTLSGLISQGIAAGIQAISFADTTSGLTPSKIMALSDATNLALEHSIALGFHGHDALGLGNANAIQFINQGVSTVDVSSSGLGRGGKNLISEIWLLSQIKEKKVDLTAICNLSYELSKYCDLQPTNFLSIVSALLSISPELTEGIKATTFGEQMSINREICSLLQKMV